MKRVFLIAVALLMLTTGSSNSDAAGRRYRSYRASNGGGLFSRMMELERRKNERLREIFFGR